MFDFNFQHNNNQVQLWLYQVFKNKRNCTDSEWYWTAGWIRTTVWRQRFAPFLCQIWCHYRASKNKFGNIRIAIIKCSVAHFTIWKHVYQQIIQRTDSIAIGGANNCFHFLSYFGYVPCNTPSTETGGTHLCHPVDCAEGNHYNSYTNNGDM